MNVHVLGIAGAGVSALASILVSQGARVTGSDEGVFPPVSTYLERLGVPFHTGFSAENVPDDLDLAIVGTTAKLGIENAELAELSRRGVPMRTFAAQLGEMTAGRENLVVAGSFGKSSLTALLAFVCRNAGLDPGHFIGAVPLDLPMTGHWGGHPLFLMEGDEYVVSLSDRRSKFELYRPAHALISSLVHDHVNMFPTFEAYAAPFAKLVAAVPEDGLLVCARGHERLAQIVAGRRVIWYGADDGGDGYRAENVVLGEITRFDLVTPAGGRAAIETQLLGRHNIENIVGAAAFVLERGLMSPGLFADGVAKFRGVARRLDKKTTVSRVPAYEGFGSSFEKARSAIEAISAHFPRRRQVVVFEPHTFSWRNRDALAWYDTVFRGVDCVFMLPPPTHGADDRQIDQAAILQRVAMSGTAVIGARDAADVLHGLSARLTGDEVVLLLSSGPLEGLAVSAPALLDRMFG